MRKVLCIQIYLPFFLTQGFELNQTLMKSNFQNRMKVYSSKYLKAVRKILQNLGSVLMVHSYKINAKKKKKIDSKNQIDL